MAGVEKVSEEEIIRAAETMLTEVGEDLRQVSARMVRRRAGGGSGRVNEIVAEWKKRKKEEGTQPIHVDAPEPEVPDVVTRALDEAAVRIRGLGPLVAGLIEAAGRSERQRCSREIAAEQERANASLEEARMDTAAAQKDCQGYSEDVDRLEAERSRLLDQVGVLGKELSAEREQTESLTKDMEALKKKFDQSEIREQQARTEAERQKELREVSDRNLSKLEVQLDANDAAHRKELSDDRKAHREELAAFRADTKETEDRARSAAADLSAANATIHQLQEQVAWLAQSQKVPKSRTSD